MVFFCTHKRFCWHTVVIGLRRVWLRVTGRYHSRCHGGVIKGANPVHVHKRDSEAGLKGWYFYDETWANEHGPFGTKEEAESACRTYAEGI